MCPRFILFLPFLKCLTMIFVCLLRDLRLICLLKFAQFVKEVKEDTMKEKKLAE